MKTFVSLLVATLMRAVGLSAQEAPTPPSPAVNEELSELYNSVGIAAVEAAGDETAKILVYAEFQRGASGMIFRYQPRGASVVKQVADTWPVEEALYRLWSFTCENDEAACWRAIVYVVDDGKVTARLLYGDQVDPEKTMYEKDEALLEEFFPGLPIEPVRP
jgi:hypothetical protein